MRLVEIEDLHRVLLTQLDDTVDLGDPWHPKGRAQGAISPGMRLRIDQETENRIVASFLGPLSYRSRERVVRLLQRLVGWEPDDTRLNLLDHWARIADTHLEHREVFYVRSPRSRTGGVRCTTSMKIYPLWFGSSAGMAK